MWRSRFFTLYLRRNGHLYETKGDSHHHYVDGHDAETGMYYGGSASGSESWTRQSFPTSSSGGVREKDERRFNDYFGDTHDEQEFEESDDEDLDWYDDATLFAGYEDMNPNEAGETIYLEYRTAKARWRRFQGSHRRKGKRTRQERWKRVCTFRQGIWIFPTISGTLRRTVDG